MKRYSLMILIALTVLMVFAALPAAAEAAEGDVLLANRVVLRIRSDAAGISLGERALTVQRRLVEILGRPEMSAEKIRAVEEKGQAMIRAGEDLIITVDPVTASLNGCTPFQLAEIWADNIRREITRALPDKEKPYSPAE